ncbi:MAG: FtsX-like permease family protein, partial [Bryobacteraceae bacterium]|nr:FtsX-like permease family protein [Bryobacteraceae bacterium]
DDQPFLVTGILAPTATPIDRGLYITFAGVEAMHHEDHEEGAAHKDEHKHEDHDHKGEAGHEDHDHPTEQVSAFFLRTKSRIDTLRLQREIATFEAEPLSAVIPGVALAELWSTVRYAEDALRIVSGFVLVVSLIGLLISLYVTLNERRREMSILRALGVGPGQIAALMMLESTVLTAFGCATGVALLMSAQTAAQSAIERNFGLYLRSASLTRDAWIALALILAAGALLGLIPAWRAYRNSLADGLSIRL